MDREHVLKWTVVIVVFIFTQFLDWPWRRLIHTITSFAWWGMVFFLVFILLPTIGRMNSQTQHEVIGFIIPRIFRTVSVVGFFSVGMGWRSAFELADWDLLFFFSNTQELMLLIGGILGTCLYLFHLFLERKEIDLAMRASTMTSFDPLDPEIAEFLDTIQIIPKIGFVVITLAALTMLLH
jgi:uncharacterized membrane protein